MAADVDNTDYTAGDQHDQEPEQGARVRAEMASEASGRMTRVDSDTSIARRGAVLHAPTDRQGGHKSTVWRPFLLTCYLLHLYPRVLRGR